MAINDHLHDVPIDEEPQQPSTGSTITFNTSDIPDTEPAPRRHRRWRRFLVWFFIIIFVALGVTFWLRYLNPYVTDAVARGYIERVDRRGIIFKTFEGEMVRKAALDDTTTVYSRDFSFTIENDSVAQRLQGFAGTGTPVTVHYRSYYGALPWRGASRNIVESFTPY